MTAYLAFAALRDKRLSLEQEVSVSVNAWKVDPSSSKMFIEPNKPVSIDNLLYGLISVSGNDAAVAVAEAVSGTEDAFVQLMNREAQRQGLTNTHFSNPHGLPSADTYTTARDLSILCRNLINDFPEFTSATTRSRSSPTTTSPSPTATACCGWTRRWTA
jgi:D-alanyl-D-alanine carboxypeptidase (penicillin-binding protein 5/6)